MAKRKKPRKLHIAPDLTTPAGRKRAGRESLWGDHGFLRLRFSNLHAISDEMWRSNQPSPAQILDHARIRGIRTIINLRGPSTKGYYLLEAEACKKANIALVDFQVFSRDTPCVETLLAARQLFQAIEYPALMHCKSGADRAGLMSVLYFIFRLNRPVEDALAQLSFRYLHIRQGKTGMLDAVFEAYLSETRGKTKAFIDWVQEDYDPAAIKKAFLMRRAGRFDLAQLLRRE